MYTHKDVGNSLCSGRFVNTDAGRDYDSRSFVFSQEGFSREKACGLRSYLKTVKNIALERSQISNARFSGEYIHISPYKPKSCDPMRRIEIVKDHSSTLMKMLPGTTPEILGRLEGLDTDKLAGLTLALHGMLLIYCKYKNPNELVSFIIKNVDIQTVELLFKKKDRVQLIGLSEKTFISFFERVSQKVYNKIVAKQGSSSFSGKYIELIENFCRYLESRATGNLDIGLDEVSYCIKHGREMLQKRSDGGSKSVFFETLAMRLVNAHMEKTLYVGGK